MLLQFHHSKLYSVIKQEVLGRLIDYFVLIQHGLYREQASSNSSIAECMFVDELTFSQSRCLAEKQIQTLKLRAGIYEVRR